MIKVKSEDIQNVDYIYCRSAEFSGSIVPEPSEFTNPEISCNLYQSQRSSQQILDLAEYLTIHNDSTNDSHIIRRWNSPKSFSSDFPLWIELANPKSFFDYFKDKFKGEDVMLMWDLRINQSKNDIEDFCKYKEWRSTLNLNVRGSEASVTILYDLYALMYESLTRAKTKLIIVTVEGSPRLYFLKKKISCLIKKCTYFSF